MIYGRELQYHRTIEFESSTQLCFVTNGMLEDHLFIDVETAPSTNNSAYISAIGKLYLHLYTLSNIDISILGTEYIHKCMCLLWFSDQLAMTIIH